MKIGWDPNFGARNLQTSKVMPFVTRESVDLEHALVAEAPLASNCQDERVALPAAPTRRPDWQLHERTVPASREVRREVNHEPCSGA